MKRIALVFCLAVLALAFPQMPAPCPGNQINSCTICDVSLESCLGEGGGEEATAQCYGDDAECRELCKMQPCIHTPPPGQGVRVSNSTSTVNKRQVLSPADQATCNIRYIGCVNGAPEGSQRQLICARCKNSCLEFGPDAPSVCHPPGTPKREAHLHTERRHPESNSLAQRGALGTCGGRLNECTAVKPGFFKLMECYACYAECKTKGHEVCTRCDAEARRLNCQIGK